MKRSRFVKSDNHCSSETKEVSRGNPGAKGFCTKGANADINISQVTKVQTEGRGTHHEKTASGGTGVRKKVSYERGSLKHAQKVERSLGNRRKDLSSKERASMHDGKVIRGGRAILRGGGDDGLLLQDDEMPRGKRGV